MTRVEEKAGTLLQWILVEAYKGGLARLNRKRRPDESGTEKPGNCFIHRYDIYQRYFGLPNDLLRCKAGARDEVSLKRYRRRRLKSAVILCESVRELLKNGLIQFSWGDVSQESQRDLFGESTDHISLTEAGIQKAESIFVLEQRSGSQRQLEGWFAA